MIISGLAGNIYATSSLAADQESQDVAKCYKLDGQPERQIEACSRIVDAGQKDSIHDFALAYHMRALGYARNNNIPKALEDMNKAVEIEPEFFAHFLNRANFLDALGQHERAIADYTTSIKLNEKCLDCYYNRGVSFGQHDEIDNASVDFMKAIEIAPNHTPSHQAMGKIVIGGLNKKAHELTLEQKYSEALDLLNKAIKIIEWEKAPTDWNYIITLTNLGEVYRRMKVYDKALAVMEKSLAVSEKMFGKDDIRTVLPIVDLALLNIEAGQYKEAKPYVDRALLINRSLSKKQPLFILLTQLSEHYAEKNKCSEAAPYLIEGEEILKTNPQEASGEFYPRFQSVLQKCEKAKTKFSGTIHAAGLRDSASQKNIKNTTANLSCRDGTVYRLGNGQDGKVVLMCVQ